MGFFGGSDSQASATDYFKTMALIGAVKGFGNAIANPMPLIGALAALMLVMNLWNVLAATLLILLVVAYFPPQLLRDKVQGNIPPGQTQVPQTQGLPPVTVPTSEIPPAAQNPPEGHELLRCTVTGAWYWKDSRGSLQYRAPA